MTSWQSSEGAVAVIHLADPRLVRLVAIGKKDTHRFPANYREDGQITHPKITAGKVHRVYTEAPFGKDGNPAAQPLLEVMIDDIYLDVLGDMTDQDAVREGFAHLEVYKTFWNQAWTKKGLKFETHHHHPVWVAVFELHKVLPAGKKLIMKLEKQLAAAR